MDAPEYKHVVLGLIFLKYISDSFEGKYDELVEEGAGEFYTSSSIVRTLVEILEPYNGRAYNPTCGEHAIIML